MWLDRSGRFFNADCGHLEFACYRYQVPPEFYRQEVGEPSEPSWGIFDNFVANHGHDYREKMNGEGWVDIEIERGIIYARGQWAGLTPSQRRSLMALADKRGMKIAGESPFDSDAHIVYPESYSRDDDSSAR